MMGAARKQLSLCLGAAALLLALLAPAGAQAQFGVKSLSAIATNADESVDTQAGSHPYEYTLDFTMNQNGGGEPEGTLRDLVVELPAGMVGNPQALPRCKRVDFDFGLLPTCPGNTQVGVAEIEFEGGNLIHTGVYNLTPSPGSPATLGVSIDNNNSLQEAGLRSESDYGVDVSDVTVPTKVEIQSVSEHIWGLPMAKSHDEKRLCPNPENHELPLIEGCSSDAEPTPFLSLPTSCTGGQLETSLRVESVEGGSASAATVSPGLEGCESLHFEPTIKARPQTAASDSPTGLEVGIHIPQNQDPKQLASAHLKETAVKLPAGLAVNPSAADGLGACTQTQINLHGAGPASCPDSAKVGTVAVFSPLVDHPLAGSVYLAKQNENPFGSLLALYVTVEDPATGVIVKLAGEVKPDPVTGQLSATFKENPQLPFEDLKFEFFGGPRATLTTPSTCATYTTTALMTPWSAPEAKSAEPSDSFPISEGPGGSACAASEAQKPDARAFEAGTQVPLGGAYSPFVLKVSRENGSQYLQALNVTLPPGLAAKLAGVTECSEAQIAAAQARSNPGEGALEQASPSCPQSSEVGTVNVGAGSGSPLYVQGHAYLAGPYKNAPLSLAIITPAVAGPFDLGTVVVRSALYVDESTAQVTVKSDPLPTILQGIPLDVRSVAVHVDRNQFMLNPTNCAAKTVSAQAISPIGTVANLSQHFQVAGCRGLEFSPRLSLRFSGRHSTARRAHPALTATLTRPEGQANFGKVSVTLPSTQFIDQNHIGNPCTRPKFTEEKCPPISELGTVTAFSPLLEKPLSGKVYFRANGGVRKLPDVVADLHGQVHFVLVGFVDSIAHGESARVRTTFAENPDAPVSKVIISFFGGQRGVLVNSQNLCTTKVPQTATVKMAGQNGRIHNSDKTPIATSCSKKKK